MFSQSFESIISILYIPPLGDEIVPALPDRAAKIIVLLKKRNIGFKITKFEKCLPV